MPDTLRAIVAILVLSVAAFGAGNWIAKLLPVSFSPLGRLACSWLGGFGVLSSALFVVGQLAFTPLSISLIVATGVLLAIPSFLRRKTHDEREHRRIPLIPAAVIIFVLALSAIAGLADIVGDWGNDAVSYHLLGPKVWLHEGVVRPVLDNSHTAFPAMAEVLFGALLWLGGPHGPGLFAVASLLVLLLIVAALGMRIGLDDCRAWWAAAFVASMPAVYAGTHTAFVDTFYASLVLAAARVAFDAERPREFVAAGLLSGFAIATKYTGLLALLALIVGMIFAMRSRDVPWRLVLRGSIMAITTALLIGAPAYIRNWILLGSPIYPPPPLLADMFHAKYLSAEAVRQFHAYIYQRGAGLGRSFSAYLLLPFNLTYHTANFNGAGGIGLYALALGPIGIVAARKNVFARCLALLALLLTTLWFVTQQESRFLIHVYAIGAVFAVFGWRYIQFWRPRHSLALCAIVVGISMAYGLFMIGKARANDVAAVFSASYAERRRQEEIPFRESFAYLNGDASVRKVLILDRSVPPYYCDKEYVKPFGQWGEQMFPDIRDAQDALEHLGELNVTHVLDVSSVAAGFQVPTNTSGLRLIFERPNQRIYKMNVSP
jgi:hypothetical protein